MTKKRPVNLNHSPRVEHGVHPGNLAMPELGPVRVLVVGEVILDRYLHGDVSRISPEAPIPVLRVTRREEKPGNAGFVMANLRALGAEVSAASVVGGDRDGQLLREIFGGLGISMRAMLTDPGRPTTVKPPLAETAKIEVTVDQQTDGASISVDLDLLKQAMLNVVINAIEAMPDGGELLFQSSVDGHDAEIRISDTGCGIPASVRNKIFGLYFTTKEKGSGIGLAMTFRIVQLHDGTINFTSEPRKGTTFIIRVPTAVS